MRAVLSLLRDRGEVASTVLCADLRVSPATLRRDLSELEEQGLLVRTHGGARALDPSGSEIPVRLRDHRMVAIKRRIAQHAAALVPAGPQAVALTGGVTTGEVARSLKGRPNMTIVTNSLTIAADCAVDAHMKVIATGGLVRANTLEAVGPMSEHAFQVITVGTAVLGADGMSAEVGATTFDEAEATHRDRDGRQRPAGRRRRGRLQDRQGDAGEDGAARRRSTTSSPTPPRTATSWTASRRPGCVHVVEVGDT